METNASVTSANLRGAMTPLNPEQINCNIIFINEAVSIKSSGNILDWILLQLAQVSIRLSKSEELLKFIFQYGDECLFEILCIALQIMLKFPISIAIKPKSILFYFNHPWFNLV